MSRLLAVLLCLTAVGCRSLPRETYSPEFIRLCLQAKAEARDRIEARNAELGDTTVLRERPVYVQCVDTTRYKPAEGGRMPVWYSRRYKRDVGGICYGSRIRIARGLKTKEIYYEALVHEFAHYWIWHTYGTMRQLERYSECFYNW